MSPNSAGLGPVTSIFSGLGRKAGVKHWPGGMLVEKHKS